MFEEIARSIRVYDLSVIRVCFLMMFVRFIAYNMCLKSFDVELSLDRSTLKSPSIRMFALWSMFSRAI